MEPMITSNSRTMRFAGIGDYEARGVRANANAPK